MKKRLLKFVSLMLASLICLTSFIGVTVSASEKTLEYYVAPNGTGDGRTANTPANAITTVMQSIIDDRHDAGEEVTIYVKGGEGATSVPASGLVINYAWPWPSETTPANVTITSMPGSESPAILSSSADAPLVVLANTVFKNIILHSGCADEGIADRIFTNGYNVTFDEDVVFRKGNSLTAYTPKIHIGSGYSWGVQSDASGTVTINNTSNNKNFAINFGGFTWNGEGESNAKYLKGNKTVIVNGGTVDSLNLVGFMSGSQYDSNINVVLNGTKLNKAGVSERAGYEPTINGKIQIVANGTTLPDDVSGIVSYAKGKNIPYYVINSTSASNGSNDLLTLTDEVGTYAVKSGEVAIAVDLENSEQVFTSESEKLTVPVGEYLVTRKGTGGGEGTYYVQYGGTGDGLSPESPLATVDDAVKAANMAGYSTDDTVYINVMQSADWNWGAGEIGAGGNYRADAHHMTTWAPRGALTEHKARIVVQGYGEGTVYLATNGQLGFNLDMVLGGPTVFGSITIVRMRRWRGLLANGHDVTYGAGTVFGCVNVDDCDNNFKTWDGKVDILDGTTTIALGNVNKLPSGGGGKIELYNEPQEITVAISSIQDIWGTGGVAGPTSETEKYVNDVTLVYDNEKIFSSILWGNQYGGSTLFEKNLNLNIKSANKIQYAQGNGDVTINGAFQVISTSKVDLPDVPENVLVNGGLWSIINCDESDSIDFTDVAGTYSVKDGKTLVAVDLNDKSKTYISENGLLTMPAGKYRVSAAGDQVTYFIQYGGIGDGMSPETPFSTVADAINAANNAGYGSNDTVFINVLQSNDWNWGAGSIGAGDNYRADAHHMTTWAERGAVNSHEFTAVIQGEVDGGVYLASSGYLGLNVDMVLGGPTIFKDVTIVRMRRWRGIYANGYDVLYGNGTKFACVDVDDCDSSFQVWNGTVNVSDENATISLGNVNKLSDGSGGTIKFNNETALSTLTISSIADIWTNGSVTGPTSNVEKYANDVNIIYNNSNFVGNIRWGNQNGGSSLFEKNLNIDVDNIKSINHIKGSGTVVIGGALQIISSVELEGIASIPDNVIANGGKWFIQNNGISNLIDFTEYAGTFFVKSGCGVVATNIYTKEKFYSANGKLTIPAGEYIIEESDFDDGVTDIVDLVRLKKFFVGEKESVGSFADYNGDNVINSEDLVILKKHLLGVEFAVGGYLMTTETLSGGADVEAMELKETIMSKSDSITSTGRTYYVSTSGKDSNWGWIENYPIQTISKVNDLNLKSGDRVLFKRGDTFRTNERLNVVSGVSYGAYGKGDKPKIYGSLRNYASKDIWQSDNGILWKTSLAADDAGNIVFNDGEAVGVRKETLSQVKCNGDYYFDVENSCLYMYLREKNPGEFFNSIEIASTEKLIRANSNAKNVKIENLTIKYAAEFGISIYEGIGGFEISGCEIGWIGGGYMGGTEGNKRFGNAIELWCHGENSNITNNYIYQVYDAAITFQGGADNTYKNLNINSNLIEYCSMNFEFWAAEPTVNEVVDKVEISDINFTNNILRFSGFGFGGKQRPSKSGQAFVLAWNYLYNDGQINNFNINGNIFDCANSYFFYGRAALENVNIFDNSYYQIDGSEYFIVRGMYSQAKNEKEFAKAIYTIDKSARLIKWLSES